LTRHFLKLDVEKFFDSVDHEYLMAAVKRLIKDPEVLRLVQRIIDHGPVGSAAGKGLPIGNLTSQHLANLYLAGLDQFVKRELRCQGYLRYMDDLLLFGESATALRELRDRCAGYLKDGLALLLKPEATVLAPVTEGIPWLGLRVFPAVVRLGQRPRRRLARAIRLALRDTTDDIDPAEGALAALRSRVGHTLVADSHRLRRRLVQSSFDLGGRSHSRARTG